jgi:hypothetical protein
MVSWCFTEISNSGSSTLSKNASRLAESSTISARPLLTTGRISHRLARKAPVEIEQHWHELHFKSAHVFKAKLKSSNNC